MRYSIFKHESVTRNAANWSVPTIFDSSIHVAEVEAFKCIKKRNISVSVLLNRNFWRKENLVDVADEDQEVEAEICEAGGD